jgi:hypothetical protein
MARCGRANGETPAGFWMVPAMSAASLTLRFDTSFPKKRRDASATP